MADFVIHSTSADAMDRRLELKRLKEEFVSDLSGTTVSEVFSVIACLPLSLLLGGCLWRDSCVSGATIHTTQHNTLSLKHTH